VVVSWVLTKSASLTSARARDAWARRPQAAALVAQLADPDRGWDAIVVGEYERAFYGSQYASMAPLFEHYGVSLWMPEVGGRVDWHADDRTRLCPASKNSAAITPRPAVSITACCSCRARDDSGSCQSSVETRP
jgi:hypothetical protein